MERKSYALITVVFVAVFSALILCAIFFLGRERHSPKPYRLHSVLPVYGLHTGSKVKFRGIDVGHVDSVGFSKEEPGYIDVVLMVNEGTPVTKGTVAAVDKHPVTGFASVNLLDDGDDPTRLVSSEESPVEIPVVQGNIGKVKVRGMEILHEVQVVTEGLAHLFNTPQDRAVYALLVDLNKRSKEWAQNPVTIGRVALKVPGTVREGHEFFQSMLSLSADVKKVMVVVDKKMKEHLSMNELDDAERLASKARGVLRSINEVLGEIQRKDRSLLTETIRGKGPGE